MPYLTKENKLLFKDVLGQLPKITTAGELNYLITSLGLKYLEDKSESYQLYNDIIGAMTAAIQEFYRRKVVPYEEYKAKVNGDVFPSDAYLLSSRK